MSKRRIEHYLVSIDIDVEDIKKKVENTSYDQIMERLVRNIIENSEIDWKSEFRDFLNDHTDEILSMYLKGF